MEMGNIEWAPFLMIFMNWLHIYYTLHFINEKKVNIWPTMNCFAPNCFQEDTSR